LYNLLNYCTSLCVTEKYIIWGLCGFPFYVRKKVIRTPGFVTRDTRGDEDVPVCDLVRSHFTPHRVTCRRTYRFGNEINYADILTKRTKSVEKNSQLIFLCSFLSKTIHKKHVTGVNSPWKKILRYPKMPETGFKLQ
jgi:hypothetical protein